jgi:hypothetical protein
MKSFPLLLKGVLLALVVLLTPSVQAQSMVEVRYTEGLVHGFVVLRAMDGSTLAHGDLTQVPRGERVTSRLVLNFKDGSLYEESVSFSQRDVFKVLDYHLVQKGPAFKVQIDMTIDTSTGLVHVSYTDEDGKAKEESRRFDFPPDLVNGLVPILLKNIRPDAKETTVSLVAATPEPRLVKLVISPEGEAEFLIGEASRKAMQYRMQVEIGGLLGFFAPLVGKEPEVSHAWVLPGDAPAFLRLEGQLFMGGPIWRIELSSPVWQGR